MADARDLLTHADIIAELEKLRDNIIQAIESNGLRASGRTQRSMSIKQEGNKIGLYSDRPFFPALETGSSNWTGKTGVRCSFIEFKGIIKQWAMDKGLPFKNDDKVIAAVAMSIIKHGTKTYQQGGRSDIYSPYIIEAFMNISDKLHTLFGGFATETLLRFTKPT